MRNLNESEIVLVHGAGLMGDLWDKFKALWETKETVEDGVETMKDWMEAYDHLNQAITEGKTSAQDACDTLGSLLKLVPDSEGTKPYAGELVAAMCNHGANLIQHGIDREKAAIDAMENGDAPPADDDTALNQYYEDPNWLDNLLAGYNGDAVDDYWAGTGSYGSVEIEICNA